MLYIPADHSDIYVWAAMSFVPLTNQQIIINVISLLKGEHSLVDSNIDIIHRIREFTRNII